MRNFLGVFSITFLIVGCGGGSGGGGAQSAAAPTTSSATFSLGGTVRGLSAGRALTLQSGTGQTLNVGVDGDFTFPVKLSAGTAYVATIASSPPGQVCVVNRASGMVSTSDVGDIEVLCNSAAATQQGIPVTTLAGIAGDFGQTDGPLNLATFACPIGITGDGNGGLLVTDANAQTVRNISQDGIVKTVAGVPLNTSVINGQINGVPAFAAPSGIVRDSIGNIYLADVIWNNVRKIDISGKVTTIDLIGVASPSFLATDGADNVYVAETTRNIVVKIDPAGIVTRFAGMDGVRGSADGGRLSATFNIPYGLAVDKNGNVFVSEFGNHTIRKISPDGVVTTLAGVSGVAGSDDGVGYAAKFNNPAGLAIDGAGNLYVVDNGNRTIREITAAGVVSTLAGSASVVGATDGLGAAASFKDPYGITVDSSGEIYVTDCGNNTIRKLSPGQPSGPISVSPPQTVFAETAVVSTVAGKSGEKGYVDGAGTAARFGAAGPLTFDRAGNLVVGDNAPNNVLRIVAPNGQVRTLAGKVGSLYSDIDGQGVEATFTRFLSIASDPAGSIYMPIWGTDKLRKVSSSGMVTTLTIPLVDRPLSGIAFDPSGNLLAIDSYYSIDRINLLPMQVNQLAGRLSLAFDTNSVDGPGSLARFGELAAIIVDSTGNAFVADVGNLTIRKITPAGIVSTVAGMSGSPRATIDGNRTVARLFYPSALAIDGAGNLYFTDNQTIRKVAPTGIVTTVAGLAGATGYADGVGSQARFSNLQGIAVDKDGIIYVSDNNAIRKIVQH